MENNINEIIDYITKLINSLSYFKNKLIEKPKETKTFLMPFGKHQGKDLKEVPQDYLEWLKTSGALDKEMNRELREALETLRRVQL